MTPDDALPPAEQALLRRLGDVVGAADPVPDVVLEAARAAFSLRRLDEDLAELVHDSVLEAAGVRGGAERLLSFETGTVTIELQVTPRGAVVDLLGQVDGPDAPATTVVVETDGEQRETTVDTAGTFVVRGVPAGRLRLAISSPGRSRVTTSWVLV